MKEIEESLNTYRDVISNLEQSTPNALILGISVIFVYVAGFATTNYFAFGALFFLGFSLVFSIVSLVLSKNLYLKAYNQLSFGRNSIETKQEELKKRGINDLETISNEFGSLIQSFNSHEVAKLKDNVNFVQRWAVITFVLGVVFTIFASLKFNI